MVVLLETFGTLYREDCLRMESSVHNGDARTLRRQGNDHNSEVLGDEYQKPPWSERAQRSTAVYVCSKLL